MAADTAALTSASHVELELGLIQTHMAQKPVLRVEVGTRVLRMRSGIAAVLPRTELEAIGPPFIIVEVTYYIVPLRVSSVA